MTETTNMRPRVFLGENSGSVGQHGGGFGPGGMPWVPLRDKRFAETSYWTEGKPYCGPTRDVPYLGYGEKYKDQDWRFLPEKIFKYSGNPKKAPTDHVPDVITMPNRVVNASVKRILETIDPGNHQFHDVEICSRVSGQQLSPSSQHYYWNVLTWLAPERVLNLDKMGIAAEQRRIRRGRTAAGEYDEVVGTIVTIPSYGSIKLIIDQSAWVDDMKGKHVCVSTPHQNESGLVS